jgi:hypothetical protein
VYGITGLVLNTMWKLITSSDALYAIEYKDYYKTNKTIWWKSVLFKRQAEQCKICGL